MDFSMQHTCLAKEIESFTYNNPYRKFNVNNSLWERNLREIDIAVSQFMKDIEGQKRSHKQEINGFFNYINSNPAVGERGTTSIGSLFWLFIIARSLNPTIIVESGVLKGSSLHCYRHACKNADIFGFDLNLKNMLFQDQSIHLHETDWSKIEIKAKTANDLCYFDDHINNGLRIKQAFDRGFKNLIFDDAPSLGEIHKMRYPGLPTVPMIVENQLQEGDCIQWFHKNSEQYLEYTFSEEHTYGAKDLIQFAKRIPSLESLTSQSVGIQYFVRLK